MLDEPEITDHPDAQHDGNPPVNRDDKHQRGNNRRYRKHHGVQEFGDHIGQRPRRLHLFLRNPAREIIVKKRDRLPQRPAVQPRQDQHIQRRRDRHGLHAGVHPKSHRAQDQQENGDSDIGPAMRRP